MKKIFSKAFTMVEMLVVVLIISMLIILVRGLFSYRNIDRVNFDSCFIKTYSKIDKFFQEALSQKSVYTWGSYKTPDYYNVIFDYTEQKLLLSYSWLKTEGINFVWDGEDDKNKCYTISYHTYISWDISKVKIKAWLQVDTASTSEAPMELYDKNGSLLSASQTGGVSFYYCEWVTNNNCLEKYKIEVDPRSYLFKTYFCLKLKNDWSCEKWSE